MKKIILFLSLVVTTFSTLAAYKVTTTNKLRVWAEIPEPLVADGHTVNYIKVYQHDDDDLDYSAFNMEFILPEGFTLNQVKEGRREVNDIKLSERADVTHSISCNIVDGVDLRIIADSSENADLYKDDESGQPLDELFTVGLVGDPEKLIEWTYTIELKGILFVQKNADAVKPADDPVYYTVHVSNPVTGIEEVEADALDPDQCYDLAGRKVDPRAVHGVVVICNGVKYLIR